MKTWTFLTLLLLLPALGARAQQVLVILEDDGAHLVTGSTGIAYKYLADGREKSAGYYGSRTRFQPVGAWFPGHILVQDLEARELHTQYTDASMEKYELEYTMKVTADRDFDDTYLVMYTERPDGQRTNIVCKVGSLRKGDLRKLRYTLTVPAAYSDSRFRPIFMSHGYQVMTSEVKTASSTPLELYLEQHPGEKGKDGMPKPLRVVQPGRPVAPGTRELIHGAVEFEIEVDSQGYVYKARPVKPSDGPLVQAVYDVIYLWEFKPKIEKGKPVKCSFRVPFNF